MNQTGVGIDVSKANLDVAWHGQAQTGQAMMGQHDMTGTVETISANNIVDVRTDDGVLRMHFPNATRNLKKGDKIILHLSYTMDASSGM